MSWLSVAPVAAAMLVAVVLGRVTLPLHPSWTARLLATVAGALVVILAGSVGILALGYVLSFSSPAAGLVPAWWLPGDHYRVPHVLGLGAVAFLCLRLPAIVMVIVRRARELRAAQAAAATVVDSDIPFALAVPGRRGGVLVSRGLLKGLNGPELEVVFQHERAHLRYRHHHYLYMGALARALLPSLEPLSLRLRYALERWADEEAADAVNDRELVARTIGKVALAQTSPSAGEAAFADWGVPGRVQALLTSAPGKNTVTGPCVVGGTGLAGSGLASTALQLDHVLAFVLL
ncbi:M56 family metallopeptidase [Spirillospora sp. NPDC047279]|uniref:M56 family metallopeptidase n=1 Tax=Spirillospora sp. NPDC047279 TaxID=3155478 RepID=UPI0033DF059B